MARIDHSFSIDKPPHVAQAMFLADIAPELAKDRDFQVTRERPGQLIFSDGSPGSGIGELEESEEEQGAGTADAALGPNPSGPRAQNLNARLVADDLPGLLARHIHVDFSAEGTGTRVRVHGHLERDVCHGLKLLGTPQHWPENADQPHD